MSQAYLPVGRLGLAGVWNFSKAIQGDNGTENQIKYFILQLIPQISSLTPVTTIVPLVAVLLITALKDGIDDIVSILCQ